jgi:HD-GYP domain-containing protein (c-di-GMP phosphodiesterase class II)
VVDAFDAMTTDRPYREALSPEEAVEELRREAGTQFDPRARRRSAGRSPRATTCCW